MATRWNRLRTTGLGLIKQVFSAKKTNCRVFPFGLGASHTSQCDQHTNHSYRNFRRAMTSDSSGLYFTARSVDGVNVDNTTCRTLSHLFYKDPMYCFDNITASSELHCFSTPSLDIFRQVLRIGYEKAKIKQYFLFDPTTILVKQEGSSILVLIPEHQIMKDVTPQDEITEELPYGDMVVGPLAQLMHSLQTESQGFPGTQHTPYKEISDLLYHSKNAPWWISIEDILAHPVFWTVEQKLAAIVCANIWMDDGKTQIKNNLQAKARIRTFSHMSFIRALQVSDHAFYNIDYTVRELLNGGLKVSIVKNSYNWTTVFENVTFHHGYNFGNDKILGVHGQMIRFIRNLLSHFGDDNFSTYSASLARETLQVAVIELDRKFSLSLTIYYALRVTLHPSKPPNNMFDFIFSYR